MASFTSDCKLQPLAKPPPSPPLALRKPTLSACSAPLSVIQEPKWRVQSLLSKMAAKVDSENRIKANPNKGYSISDELIAVYDKFIIQVKPVFESLPKPKDWYSFFRNDIPLLFTANEVQQFALEHRLNKAQTKAVNELRKAAPEVFKEIAATKIHLAATLRMGAWLKGAEKAVSPGWNQYSGQLQCATDHPPTYSNLGIEKTDAFRVQRLWEWEKETAKASNAQQTPEKAIERIVELASDPVKPVTESRTRDIEDVRDLSAETIRQAAKNHQTIQRQQVSIIASGVEGADRA